MNKTVKIKKGPETVLVSFTKLQSSTKALAKGKQWQEPLKKFLLKNNEKIKAFLKQKPDLFVKKVKKCYISIIRVCKLKQERKLSPLYF